MSLTLRLTLTYILVTLGGLMLLGSGFIAFTERSISQQQEQSLQVQATIYADFLAEIAQTPTELRALAPYITSDKILPPDINTRIFATNGALLSNSAGLGPFPSQPVLAFTTNTLPLPISQAAEHRYVACPILSANESLGIVELSHSTLAERQLRDKLRAVLLQATLLTMLAMIVMSVLVARTIARPIIRLTHHAQALSAGKLNTDVTFPIPSVSSRLTKRLLPHTQEKSAVSRNELNQLAHSLNHMANQLVSKLTEAEQERARLNVVLAAISEGVIALDTAGELIFANPAAHTLLEAPTQHDISQRLTTLNIPLHTAQRSEYETGIGSRYMLFSVIPVQPSIARTTASATPPTTQAIHTVLVLRDITQLKDLEEIRARFFRNVSHDLRTPLTAIRGTLENMRDSAPVDQQTALNTLESEAARLSRLVDELLHPSDNGALLLKERCRIDMGTLAQELCALQQGRTRRAGIQLTCIIPPDIPPIIGDRDRIKQALLNLLDNAMKVTPTGGTIQVEITQSSPTTLRVSVTDSGPGVPPELQEQIWERGVRGISASATTDGANYGGLGLGLAITREIITAHNGRAWVESQLSHGARFILEFPLQIASP